MVLVIVNEESCPELRHGFDKHIVVAPHWSIQVRNHLSNLDVPFHEIGKRQHVCYNFISKSVLKAHNVEHTQRWSRLWHKKPQKVQLHRLHEGVLKQFKESHCVARKLSKLWFHFPLNHKGELMLMGAVSGSGKWFVQSFVIRDVAWEWSSTVLASCMSASA